MTITTAVFSSPLPSSLSPSCRDSAFPRSIPRRTIFLQSMATPPDTNAVTTTSDPCKPLDLTQYPIPLSPPYPPLSKEIELRRAMSASSRSSLFVLTEDRILFQDDWLVVVDKPRGIYCETLLASYSAFHQFDGMPKPELHLANRLDRDTSGVTVITKSHKVAAKLVKAFTEHSVRKTYAAMCVGRAPEWNAVRVVSGHGRSRHGAWRVYAASNVGRVLPGGSVVKHMATTVQVMPVWEHGEETSTVTVEEWGGRGGVEEELVEVLVRARPESGRTHQIRLHCQYLGVPIRGDVKYGGVDRWNGVECEGHDLHAESLELEHPLSGAPMRFVAPLPSWAGGACGLKETT